MKNVEAFLDILTHLSGAQIWLIVAGTVFAICAIMMFIIFWQFNKHKGELIAMGRDSEPEAFLIDLSKKTDRERYKISDKPTMVGRIPANDVERYDSVVIPDVTVGRRHAVLDHHDDAFWIQDQGSVNGTFVNGRRIEGEHRLQDGDEVKIHKFSFQFVDKSHSRQEATEQSGVSNSATEQDMTPSHALAGHGDTMLDIPKFSVEQREKQLRTQVLNQSDFAEAVIEPKKLKISDDAIVGEDVRDTTIRLVADPDGDKTTRLYSDLLDGPPVNRPDFKQFVKEAAEIEEQHMVEHGVDNNSQNPFKEVKSIPDIDEKVIEALGDFFSDSSDNPSDGVSSQIKLTSKGDKLAQMGRFAGQPLQPLKQASNGKSQKNKDD